MTTSTAIPATTGRPLRTMGNSWRRPSACRGLAEEAATALNDSRAGPLAMRPFWAEPFSDRIPEGPTIPIYPALSWERIAL